jgi:OPA family glycerol-3-phosphate transporter-like MFS transporter
MSRRVFLPASLAAFVAVLLVPLGAYAAEAAQGGGAESPLVTWLKEGLAPIVILLVAIGFVLARLPKIELGHTAAFRKRRVWNWLPLGLLYAFMYMGRYNLTVSKRAFEEIAGLSGGPLMGNEDFGLIFGVGTVVYGFSFLINGPLTDRIGGRKAILIGGAGVILANIAMALLSLTVIHHGPMYELAASSFVPIMATLYAANMYFQSFGAVAIVKVNAPWFHVRERGVFGAIFGILISLGLYFAYDWSRFVLMGLGLAWVFFAPAILLTLLWIAVAWRVKDTPGQAGHVDFDTADASSGDTGPQLGAMHVFKLMLRNPIIITIALVEFCSGFLRQAVMQWYQTFAKQTNEALGLVEGFVYQNWGLVLCIAGILGGVVAGVVSDRVFQSRRGPVAAFLYGVLLASGIVLIFTYQTPAVQVLVLLAQVAVIGVHGMLSGTASMDFGGRKNVGVAVGIIDGFVYLGTATMSFTYAIVLPKEQLDAAGQIAGPATDPANWIGWPVAMVPIALFGLVLATRLWNAKPQPKGAAAGH